MTPFDLSGHQALVTGSTRGIGRSLALGLEQAGAEVLLHGLPCGEDSCPEALREDLCEPGAPERLMAKALEAKPLLDLLVCNAGGFFDVPFSGMDRARWEKTMRLHLEAPYFLIQAFSRSLQARGKGARQGGAARGRGGDCGIDQRFPRRGRLNGLRHFQGRPSDDDPHPCRGAGAPWDSREQQRPGPGADPAHLWMDGSRSSEGGRLPEKNSRRPYRRTLRLFWALRVSLQSGRCLHDRADACR